MLFWVVICGLIGHEKVLEKHTASIFRTELGSWEFDSLYRVRTTTLGGRGNWPTRGEEFEGGGLG
jgi:hypothetical protein